MKKLFVYSLILFSSLFSCSNQDVLNNDENNNNDENVNKDDNKDKEEIIYKEEVFSHEFKKEEISSKDGGSFSSNGLDFTYSSSTYIGYDSTNNRGIQIGSGKSPQKDKWVLATQFSESVRITSFSVELSHASGGTPTYFIEFGDYSISENYSVDGVSIFTLSKSELDILSSSFSIGLASSSKAMYIKSLSISFLVNSNSSFSVYIDSDKEEEKEVSSAIPGEGDIPSTVYSLTSISDYYSDIDFSSSTLINDLRELISSDITLFTYGDSRYCLQYIDEDISKKGYIYSFFDGDKLNREWDSGASWNREHVWPRSRMLLTNESTEISNATVGNFADLHNLRASCKSANSSHGNRAYDEENSDSTFFPNITSGLGSSNTHEYSGDFRGDVARILCYMAVRYEGLTISDDVDNENNNIGKLSTLKKWNSLDPVDEFERQRNDRIYEYQGNRNPFIDYPNLVDTLF